MKKGPHGSTGKRDSVCLAEVILLVRQMKEERSLPGPAVDPCLGSRESCSGQLSLGALT